MACICIFFLLYKDLRVCSCVHAEACAGVSADTHDDQRLRMPLELELSGCELPDKWVLGIKLGSWRSALNC